MPWKLSNCEWVLLADIANPKCNRRDIAQTYALAMRSPEGRKVDWGKVNRAILARWPKSLETIKRMAHSGACFREVAK